MEIVLRIGIFCCKSRLREGNQIGPDLHFIEKFILFRTNLSKMTIESKWSI